MAAVVPEGDGLGKRNIQPATSGDSNCDLSNFQGMGQPRSLVIVGEDENLGLASQPSKSRRMQYPIPVTFETSSIGIWLFADLPIPCPNGPRRTWRQIHFFHRFAFLAQQWTYWPDNPSIVPAQRCALSERAETWVVSSGAGNSTDGPEGVVTRKLSTDLTIHERCDADPRPRKTIQGRPTAPV